MEEAGIRSDLVQVASVVNASETSRAVLTEFDDLVVSDVHGSMANSGVAIKDNITRLSMSSGDSNTVAGLSTSVTSSPLFTIEEVSSLTESTPVEPGDESTAVSEGRNALMGADMLLDTRPTRGALSVRNVFARFGSPQSSSLETSTI